MTRSPIAALAATLACALTPASALAVQVSGRGEIVREGSAATHGPRAAAAPVSNLQQAACLTGALPASRGLVVKAQAQAFRGVGSLQMRFHLLKRAPNSAEAEVEAPGLGSWESLRPPAPNAKWILTKRLTGLDAPATYRVRVDYAWRAAGGRLLAQRSRTGPLCSQPDLRPDLRLGSVTTALVAGTPGMLRYTVPINNIGKGASAPTILQLLIGGDSRQKAVRSIAKGGTRTVTIDAPVCAGGQVATLQIDPGNVIGESRMDNNIATVACSSPGAG